MFFAKLHPYIVHFAVALLVSGALFEAYGKLFRESTVALAGWFNVRLGFWCALPTAVIGLLGVVLTDIPPKAKTFVGYHLISASLTITLFLGVLLLGRFGKNQPAKIGYYLFLGLGLCSIIATGFYGGELVHRFGVATLQPLE